MPLFDYTCNDCNETHDHFVHPGRDLKKICPTCGSGDYNRRFSGFRMDVEYGDPAEHHKKKFNKEMGDIYKQIGKEALSEDTKTLDNLFGKDKVENTFSGSDYD